MSGPGFEQALERIATGEAEVLVVQSTDILTAGEVVRILEAGGRVAFAHEDVELEGTVRHLGGPWATTKEGGTA